MHAHSNPVGPQRTKEGSVDGVAWHQAHRQAIRADAPDLYELRRAVWWRVEDTAHTQHTQKRPKQCGNNACMDSGDGDEGGGVQVEKGQGQDKLEQGGDEVERQKNNSAMHAAHAHGNANEEEDDKEGNAADNNIADIAEGLQCGEARDAAFCSDAEHPMALYVYPSNTPTFPRVIESASQRRVWCLDTRIWYLPKQKDPAQASVLKETADTKSESIICVAKIVESVTYVEVETEIYYCDRRPVSWIWVLSGNNEDMKSIELLQQNQVYFQVCRGMTTHPAISAPYSGDHRAGQVKCGNEWGIVDRSGDFARTVFVEPDVEFE
ncbi:hypothetical protein JB92DRAFT_2834597 [Gautieria morchelliformis]|nr:hypothetical protein JB92DRAFT_2834597 [Gautieria morchelliformis]